MQQPESGGRSLSEISGVPEPIEPEEIVPSSERLAEFMHKGERRLNGEPYINHPKRVKSLGNQVLKETEYKIIGQASFLCHDLGEIGVAIFDPFGKTTDDNPSSLNYFFRNVRKPGDGICYIVKELTNLPGISYMVQMRGGALNVAPASDEICRPLDILKVIGKGLDMLDNVNPEETVDEDYYKEVYRGHAEKGDVRLLKTLHNLSEYFEKGEEISSEEMFIKALKEKLADKLLSKAIDSIDPYVEPSSSYPYLPVVERLLFQQSNEMDRALFNQDAMRDILGEWKSKSDIIIEKYGKGKIYLVHSTGYFRGLDKQPGAE